MTPFRYPIDVPKNSTLAKHNAATEAGTYGRTGHMAVAFDVWRDGAHLWRSYDVNHAESYDTWARRNYPDLRAPEYAGLKMGVQYGAPTQDRDLVPTRDALRVTMTYPQIAQLLRAALATAQYPASPERADLVPAAGTIRQRVHQSNTDWIKVAILDLDNRISIRAIIGPVDERLMSGPQATYQAKLIAREGSNLQNPLPEREAIFTGPHVDLSNTRDRRTPFKTAKTELNVTGLHCVARGQGPTECSFSLTAHPNTLTLTHLGVIPTPESETTKGLDIE